MTNSHQYSWKPLVIFSVLILAGFAAHAAIPQNVMSLEGAWQGALGGRLHIVLTFTKDASGAYAGSLNSVDQGAMLPMQKITLDNGTVHFAVSAVGGVYQGTLSKDGKAITGTWTQTGVPAQPLNFTWLPPGAAKPEVKLAPASPPVALADLKPVIDSEFAPVLDHGLLANSTGGGIVIGVYDHGQTKIFAYGTAQPDSVFEIGSVTKTFTALALAQLVEQKTASLSDTVRSLLPDGAVAKPEQGSEIDLADLATQHAGLPRMPDNFHPKNAADPYADYGAVQMYEYLSKHPLVLPANPEFVYSNLGFGLLGYALSVRAGMSYDQLIKTEITGPLHMNDTSVRLSGDQAKRLIQGYDAAGKPTGEWTFDVLAGAGALVSTAPDMLTYLAANLHPDKIDTGAPGSPASTLPAAIALTHQLRNTAVGDLKIGLAWLCNDQTRRCFHDGGTGGYTSYVVFMPKDDRAFVILYNHEDVESGNPFTQRVFANVASIMAGEPVPPLEK